MATHIEAILCPHCGAEWKAPEQEDFAEDGAWDAIVLICTSYAAHLRDEHDDEEHAIRAEHWVVNSRTRFAPDA